MFSHSFVYNERRYEIESLTENDSIHKCHRETNNFYELDVLKKIKSMEIGGTYLDIGANIGNHSIFFLNECTATKLVSVEMVKDVFDVLVRNIKRNMSKGKFAYLLNKAVTSTVRTVSHEPLLDFCVGGTRMVDSPRPDPNRHH